MTEELWKRLDAIRVHLIVSHKLGKERDCTKVDKHHWNHELYEIVKTLQKFEESSRLRQEIEA